MTLAVPDEVLQPRQRVAQATRQAVEALMVAALPAALPSPAGLSAELIEPLVAWESLDDQALWRVRLETVPRLARSQPAPGGTA